MGRRGEKQPATKALTRKQHFAFAGFGLLILSIGVSTLGFGSLHYSNWWGGMVFAPFAILVGLAAIGVALVARRKQES